MILAFDPGTTNFAYCLLDEKTLKIHRIGLLKTTFNEFNNPTTIILFKRQLANLWESCYAPGTKVVIERFMNRGRMTGATNEYVNVMIGIMLEKHPYAQCISSGEWKSYMRRRYVSDEMVKEVLSKKRENRERRNKNRKRRRRPKNIRYVFEMEHIIESRTLTEHEMDALGIAVWKAEQLRKQEQLLWKVDDSLLRKAEP